MTDSKGSTVHIQPFDSSVLIDIYLDGISTGAASAARFITNGTTAEVDKFADDLVRVLQADPAAMEVLRREVFDRIRGVDNGPFDFTTYSIPEGT